jgi:hypothetical protein
VARKDIRRIDIGQRWKRRFDPQVMGTVIQRVNNSWVWEADEPFVVEYKGRLEAPKRRMVFLTRHDMYRQMSYEGREERKEGQGRRKRPIEKRSA